MDIILSNQSIKFDNWYIFRMQKLTIKLFSFTRQDKTFIIVTLQKENNLHCLTTCHMKNSLT